MYRKITLTGNTGIKYSIYITVEKIQKSSDYLVRVYTPYVQSIRGWPKEASELLSNKAPKTISNTHPLSPRWMKLRHFNGQSYYAFDYTCKKDQVNTLIQEIIDILKDNIALHGKTDLSRATSSLYVYKIGDQELSSTVKVLVKHVFDIADCSWYYAVDFFLPLDEKEGSVSRYFYNKKYTINDDSSFISLDENWGHDKYNPKMPGFSYERFVFKEYDPLHDEQKVKHFVDDTVNMLNKIFLYNKAMFKMEHKDTKKFNIAQGLNVVAMRLFKYNSVSDTIDVSISFILPVDKNNKVDRRLFGFKAVISDELNVEVKVSRDSGVLANKVDVFDCGTITVYNDEKELNLDIRKGKQFFNKADKDSLEVIQKVISKMRSFCLAKENKKREMEEEK